MDCKYPHRITIALSDAAFTKLKTEMFMRHTLGDISKSMQDIIILHMINDIENGNNTHPMFLDAPQPDK